MTTKPTATRKNGDNVELKVKYSLNANGQTRSLGGKRELNKFVKLAKQGLCKIKFKGTKFLGYTSSYDVGLHEEVYEIKHIVGVK